MGANAVRSSRRTAITGDDNCAPATRRLIPTIATALVSLLAVGSATAYLIAPTPTALAVEFQVDAAASVPAGKIIIYGKATNRGRALPGVRIVLRRTNKVRLMLISRADGTFRKTSLLRTGVYVVSVSRKTSGKTRTTRTQIRLKSGRAYRITVRLVRNGGLSIMPIRSY